MKALSYALLFICLVFVSGCRTVVPKREKVRRESRVQQNHRQLFTKKRNKLKRPMKNTQHGKPNGRATHNFPKGSVKDKRMKQLKYKAIKLPNKNKSRLLSKKKKAGSVPRLQNKQIKSNRSLSVSNNTMRLPVSQNLVPQISARPPMPQNLLQLLQNQQLNTRALTQEVQNDSSEEEDSSPSILPLVIGGAGVAGFNYIANKVSVYNRLKKERRTFQALRRTHEKQRRLRDQSIAALGYDLSELGNNARLLFELSASRIKDLFTMAESKSKSLNSYVSKLFI